MHIRTNRRPLARPGFSLIELLVVISIIAILVSSIAVYFGSILGSARRSATATTLRKLDSLVQARFEELRTNFKEQEDKRSRANTSTAADAQRNWLILLSSAEQLTLTGVPTSAKLVVIKLDRYRGTFPQREEDLFGADGVESTTTDNSPLLAVWRGFNPSTRTDRTLESSELLNLALTFGISAGAGKEVVDSLKKQHVQDKDVPPNGLAELYDDWGKPLRFYNAPTRLIRPSGADMLTTSAQYALANQLMTGIPPLPASATNFTSAFNQDPLDPKGALRQLSTGSLPPPRYVPSATVETLFHTVDTYYRPMIVSCGEDEQLGLGEPAPTLPLPPSVNPWDRLANVLNIDEASDNITSSQAVGAQ